ncbi:hypothetical protein CISG_09926 [Coccidioides immitis RMSCC 3703]|uniref:Uncharacterized protein n=1 Tax=Coccidioides immitis RMSCC 3703 TaxID=454286 RepID=A0A0J8TH08_COCIT|nr:hypothetical protein CISG_09926 [Coccidioides immitis RMSCC 3703]
MSHLLAEKKSTASLRRKNSNSSLATGSNAPTDQESRDGKSAKYRSATYETVLATKGSFMAESELEVTERSKQICKTLLDKKQTIPEGTIFENDQFQKAYQKLQSKNKSRVIQDLSRLIVPAAETLATCGAKNLECLVESVNEPWGSSIAFCGPRPQPDYAVGFGRSAFTEDELNKLEPFLGDDLETYSSFFLATFYMYFPFLTSEVKGTAALDIADRQNAHSMTLAVRGVVELFKLVGREEEVNREILAFSISHDHRTIERYKRTLQGLRSSCIGGPTGIVCPPPVAKQLQRDEMWITKHSPAKGYVFCHNDLSQSNVIVDPDTLEVNGIIDWEFAGFFPKCFDAPFYRSPKPSGAQIRSLADTCELEQFFSVWELDQTFSFLDLQYLTSECTRDWVEEGPYSCPSL